MTYFERLVAANIPQDEAEALVRFFGSNPELLEHIVTVCESCAEVA